MCSLRRSDAGTPLREFEDTPAEILLRAWQAGHEPALDVLLAGLPRVSPSELAEAIRIDLEERWQRNDCQTAEDYLRRFPSVAADVELAVDVIYAEYLAREQTGNRPDLAEYQQRFPAYSQMLTVQIRLHCAGGSRQRLADEAARIRNCRQRPRRRCPSRSAGKCNWAGSELRGLGTHWKRRNGRGLQGAAGGAEPLRRH